MPLPLIPIITALATGGTLVPHAAGGMIVTSTAGYVAGTYLSTSAITGLLTGATATVGAGIALALTSMKGLMGATLARTAAPVVATTTATTVPSAATGVLGFLTGPVGIVLAVVGAVLGIVYGAYRIFMLNRKLADTPKDEEVQFTENEAKIVEGIIKKLAEKPENRMS
ncbi:hypothetical protein [Thiocapsa imhoffii]|uniref:hypothetical protein n=1 Tax=Thiocapsa imhoffii TaxID=382777 RepID=UPI001906934C|nr:hypothetical protein [Thiocapsa imhoffii]